MSFVYVFNGNTQAIELALPTGGTGKIQPPTATSPAPYQPFSIQVQRGSPPIEGPAFLDGQTNCIMVKTRDQNGQQTQLDVPAVGGATDDLWLYVFSELLLLFQTNGQLFSQAAYSWGT